MADYKTDREIERLRQAIETTDENLKRARSEEHRDLLLDQRLEYAATLSALRERVAA